MNAWTEPTQRGVWAFLVSVHALLILMLRFSPCRLFSASLRRSSSGLSILRAFAKINAGLRDWWSSQDENHDAQTN